jgi:hypothetical protein
MKVVVQRKQRIGLQLPEHPAQLLFDAIDGVKEVAAAHPQFARA